MNVRLIGIDFLYYLSKTGAPITNTSFERMHNLSAYVKILTSSDSPVRVTGALDFFQEDFERDNDNCPLYFFVGMNCYRDCTPLFPNLDVEKKRKERLEVSMTTSKAKRIIKQRTEELVKIAGLPDRISRNFSEERFEKGLIRKITPYLENARKRVDDSRSDFYLIVPK